MNIEILKDELTNDPLAVGYSGMDDEAAAASLNDTGAGRTLPVDTLEATTIYEAIDTAEFDALLDPQKEAIDRILSLSGGILVSASSKARAVILAAFPGGTATRTALVAEVTRTVSRGEEIGIGHVWPGHVQEARL